MARSDYSSIHHIDCLLPMKEIEHKFLVDPKKLPTLFKGAKITQGYLSRSPVVRIRMKTNGVKKAWLTIKGKGCRIRDEFEYEVPYSDAKQMMKLCGKRKIKKIRYEIGPWEIDQFKGRHKCLWLAEIELPGKKSKLPKLPDWIVKEVTYDPKYSNASLAEK